MLNNNIYTDTHLCNNTRRTRQRRPRWAADAERAGHRGCFTMLHLEVLEEVDGRSHGDLSMSPGGRVFFAFDLSRRIIVSLNFYREK